MAVISGREIPEGVTFKIRNKNEVFFKDFVFKNYFYLLETDYNEASEVFKDEVIEIVKDKNNINYAKIFFNNNYDRKNLIYKLGEYGIKAFEGDVSAVKRFLILNQDSKLKQEGLKSVFMDIETCDTQGIIRDEDNKIIANTPITSIAFKDLDGKVQYIANQAFRFLNKDSPVEVVEKSFLLNEKELLMKFIDVIKEYDIMYAWNGYRFDFPWLRQRFMIHELQYPEIIEIDYLEMFKKDTYENLKSYSLNNVSKHEFSSLIKKHENSVFKLGDVAEVTKIDWKEKTGLKKYYEMAIQYPELLKEYNIQDVNLMFMIENKNKFIKIHEMQAKGAHCFLKDTLYNSHVCDYLLFRECIKKNIIRKSKPSYDEKNAVVEIPGGGYTFCYKPGFYENVACFDFKSHYPTSMVNFNISIENYDGKIMPDVTTIFSDIEIKFINYCCSLTIGIISKSKIEKLINEKQEELGIEFTMEELMFRFVKNYKIPEVFKKGDCIITPADINYDTVGWRIHPHRYFKKIDAIVPMLCSNWLNERDAVKAEMKTIMKAYMKKFKDSKTIEEIKNYVKDLPEYIALDLKQIAIKLNANSLYGYFGFRGSRDYFYEIPDTITTTARFITKKTIIISEEKGYKVVAGDTDSVYISDIPDNKLNDLEITYYEYFKEFFKQFNLISSKMQVNPATKELEKNIHWTVFQLEKVIVSAIFIKKKRYYYLEDGKVKTKGGAFKKTNTIQIAKDAQKEIVKKILYKEFNQEFIIKYLAELKELNFEYNLSLDDITKYANISKNINDYGKPVVDKNTGKPKIKKDGTIQYAPIPVHIIIAKKMIEDGLNVEVGFKIPYVITEKKPRLSGVFVDDYIKYNLKYCADYYWTNITSVILEILEVTNSDLVVGVLKDFWGLTVKKIAKMKEDAKQKTLF